MKLQLVYRYINLLQSCHTFLQYIISNDIDILLTSTTCHWENSRAVTLAPAPFVCLGFSLWNASSTVTRIGYMSLFLAISAAQNADAKESIPRIYQNLLCENKDCFQKHQILVSRNSIHIAQSPSKIDFVTVSQWVRRSFLGGVVQRGTWRAPTTSITKIPKTQKITSSNPFLHGFLHVFTIENPSKTPLIWILSGKLRKTWFVMLHKNAILSIWKNAKVSFPSETFCSYIPAASKSKPAHSPQ